MISFTFTWLEFADLLLGGDTRELARREQVGEEGGGDGGGDADGGGDGCGDVTGDGDDSGMVTLVMIVV